MIIAIVQVVFPALLPLTYIPAFLARIRQLFLSLFQPYIQALVASLSEGTALLQSGINSISEKSQSALKILQEKIKLENWEYVLERCLRLCESKAEGGRRMPRVMATPRKLVMSSVDSGLDSTGEHPRQSHMVGS